MPFVVAHRAGNDLALLRRAEGVRPRLIEADVHLFNGRLEVRHLKALGPLLWDRWYFAPRGTPRLEMHELLAAAGPQTALMLDLKGGRRLGAAASAWCAAFGLPATVPLAALVMVVGGASSAVPLTPGGAGTQQVMLAVTLSQTASAAAVVSFSLQASVTLVNALLGLAAAMAVCRTLRPVPRDADSPG